MRESVMTWHKDGHSISLRLQGPEVKIVGITCPSINGQGECQHPSVGCLVDFFLKRFGLECNVGQCAAAEFIEIAWCKVGDYDLDMMQVWVIPVEDDAFGAWLQSQL